MSQILSWTVKLVISLSIFTIASGKTCTKEIIYHSTIYKYDLSTGVLKPVNQTTKGIVFVCCEGYQLIGDELVQPPKCEPICNPLCGHGECYAPNSCSCDTGYKNSGPGTCVPDESMKTQPPTAVFESSDPICNPPCGHGICYDTDRCACDEGYKHTRKGNCVIDESITTTAVSISSTSTSSSAPTATASVSKCGTCHQGSCMFGIFCICPAGFNLTQEGNCQPSCLKSCLNGRCIAPNHCECQDGYMFDSESLECKPMCNGKIYGCISGTCVGYNQCRCDNGTFLRKDELFQCIASEPLGEEKSYWGWSLLWLLIPVVVVFICFYIIIGHWKTAMANRLRGQDDLKYVFPLTNGNNHLPSSEKILAKDEFSFNEGTLRRNGNVVIIDTST